jgi:drug/metabolite transporter (DMT)-like permease
MRKPGLAADVGLLLLANIVWGSTDVVAKIALADISPGALLWSRLSIALIAFLPALWIHRSEIPKDAKGLLPFFALGAFGFFLDFYLVYFGLRLAPASHATAFRISEVLAIVLLSAIILREKVGRRAALGLICGMVGVALVLDIDFHNLSLFKSGARLGDLLIIAGIFTEGLYTVIGKSVLKKTSPLLATALAVFFGWILITIFLGPGVAREFMAHPPTLKALACCLYLGLIALSLMYWIYYQVLSRRDSHRVAIAIMLQPVVGIPLARLVFNDPMTPRFLSGAVLIAAGVYVALIKSEKAI